MQSGNKYHFLAIATSLVLAALTLQSSSTASPASQDMKKVVLSVTGGKFSTGQKQTVVAAVANHADEPPFMNGEPEHIRVVFDGEKVDEYAQYLQKQLLVYPVEPYAALFKGKELAQFNDQLKTLKKVLSTKSDKGVKELPVLPAAEAYQVFHNQIKYLPFKNGSGIAFLAAYAQDEAPLKNGDIFYTYQGLTTDGKYYVSFFCPVKVKNLPAKKTSKEGADYLSKLPRTAFDPALDTIDAMLQSISVK